MSVNPIEQPDEFCAFCEQPVSEHRRETGVAADGRLEIRIICPAKLEHVSVEVTFQR
jgi:hypothetical protein